ncbi:MAG: G5 domain-containing protein [Chloroflexi bacterium]|nr:G5 domain-containing protein [Chloroflexota bacterium]
MLSRMVFCFMIASSIIGCRSAQEEKSIDVSVIVDGRETSYSFSNDLTVDQVLAGAQIELGPRDRISHPIVSPIVDRMRITIRRVVEQDVCEQEEIAFEQLLQPKEGIPAGERQSGKVGAPGIREVCYRVVLEDDTEVEREQLGFPTVIRKPINEVMFVGTSNTVQPVAIAGRLSYINHRNAWTITDNAANKRQLTADHNLDSLVFHQRQDGKGLIFTSETDATDEFFNELWIIDASGDAQPIRMAPTDVLFGEWRPRTSNEIAYATGERSPGTVRWKALNNLWLMTIDLESGRTLGIDEVLPESSGGLYGWWGMNFAWSPNGNKLAWVNADGFGMVELADKRLIPLAQYAVFYSATDWVWLSQLSWSIDGQLLAGVLHGAPLGNEPAETSPIFDLVISSVDGRFSARLLSSAGMWAAPAFSPDYAARGAEYSAGYLAWLQAREPENSMNGEYDLMVADRDGSNRRRIFPLDDEPGIRKRDFAIRSRDYVWSPDAQFIALIYEGNLWLIDVASAERFQVTFDGETSNPVWTE